MSLTTAPLVLPTPPTPRGRGPLPIVASIVPVIAAVVLWLVTGSVLALLFAALGPLIAVASLVDSARSSRRERRGWAAESEAARQRIDREITARHTREREALGARHPDAARLLESGDAVWRPVDADSIVVGRGGTPSAVRVHGGDDHPEAGSLIARAERLEDAPLAVPLRTGVCIQGPPVIARAVLRALIAQLCLAHPPGALSFVCMPDGEDAWGAVPHRRLVAARDAVRVAAVGPGQQVPPGADVVLAWGSEGSAPHVRCGALVRVTGPEKGELVWSGETVPLQLECVSAAQAAAIGSSLAGRAGEEPSLGSRTVSLSDALSAAPVVSRERGLEGVIGMDGSQAVVVDLVVDGPHAVVAGVTGSGKSELLITWVASLCARHTTSEVAFLLADFKGGSAFDGLAALPHVTGVITDLDAAGSRRAVESLRAELRWREGELARAGARDILDPRISMPRLVIVVDEFAAMLTEHPDLHAVFTDVAARGRALGMHLVLGTQRVSGVMRDALLANCPLRVSLRVTDAGDSRAVLGTDDAALLPGDEGSRGLALLRGAADAAPRALRGALTSAEDVRAIVGRTLDQDRPRRPWLPALPDRLGLDGLVAEAPVVLGLLDDPERQRQDAFGLDPRRDRGLVVVGGPGSGKSGVLSLVAAQVSGALIVPSDPETAWDSIASAIAAPPPVILIDDVDALLGRYPLEYGQMMAERIERIAREGGLTGTCLVLSAQRLTGAVARLAELIPARAVLGMPTKLDHVVAGGDPDRFAPWAPPGRGSYGGHDVQFAAAPPSAQPGSAPPAAPAVAPWAPSTWLTGLVSRGGLREATGLAEAWGARIVHLADLAPATRIADLAHGDVGARIVVIGDADAWQAHWGLLNALRAEHSLLVDASSPTELRTIAGERGLPPYARPGARRAWLCHDGLPSRRITMPGQEPLAPEPR